MFFNYPPVPETVDATLREVARCTREGIRINTFMLDANSYLKSFVEKLTQMNRGRAFFTTPETLGDYVLVDFIEQKRALRRQQPPGRLSPVGRAGAGTARTCRCRRRTARCGRSARRRPRRVATAISAASSAGKPYTPVEMAGKATLRAPSSTATSRLAR